MAAAAGRAGPAAWRDLLIWQAGEVVYFASVWWYLGDSSRPATAGTPAVYWVAIVLRMAGELYLVALVVRDILRPRHDPVRDRRPATSDGPGGEVAALRSARRGRTSSR